jgi:hypothetical protein
MRVLMAPGGIEPPRAASKAAALSAELRGLVVPSLASRHGEPVAGPGRQVRAGHRARSRARLPTARFEEGGGRDSNPRPPGPQPGALPTELPPPRARHRIRARATRPADSTVGLRYRARRTLRRLVKRDTADERLPVLLLMPVPHSGHVIVASLTNATRPSVIRAGFGRPSGYWIPTAGVLMTAVAHPRPPLPTGPRVGAGAVRGLREACAAPIAAAWVASKSP